MKKKSFTLIELMAVILIIGILMGLVSALIPQLRERSRRTQCANNLRNVGLAIESYAQDNDLAYPFHVNKADTSDVSKLLAITGMQPYLKGDDATKLAQCPSAAVGTATYDCHNESVAPNAVDERFVCALDTAGCTNHTKPTVQLNVLFGDGRVKAAVGTGKAECEKSFKDMTGHTTVGTGEATTTTTAD